MPRSGQIQQFCWVAEDTARDFVRTLNEAGAAGYELYSTYKVIDRFMGALMVRWCEGAEVVREAMPPPQATVLKLVRDDDSADQASPEEDAGGSEI